MNPEGPPIHFLNVEYFMRILYDALFGPHTLPNFTTLLADIWLVVTILGYLIVAGLIWVLVYSIMRMQQVYVEEEEKYSTIDEHTAHEDVEHSRWAHIQELIESPHENDWRQAIIEADIMLDEVLGRHGYMGVGVGEKLKMGNPAVFHTLQDAWDAHKVRNDIAHQGSTFQLTDRLAYRTIQQFENVFREFGEL